jgi:hypothetical protein
MARINEEEEEIRRVRPRPALNVGELPTDPALRIQIDEFDIGDRDVVRRAYLQRGPHQPQLREFPTSVIGGKSRRFNALWYREFPWLEYSTQSDAIFCLWCYLFPLKHFGSRDDPNGVFICSGFRNWKKKDRLVTHVGSVNSFHRQAEQNCVSLMNQAGQITQAFQRQTDQAKANYKLRLNASISCVRFLQHQGLAFRGHNEDESSHNRGNFLELLQLIADHNQEIKEVILGNAPGNNSLISPDIQKDIAQACAMETLDLIMADVGDSLFSILVDECKDSSNKEQLAIVLRYVNAKGCVKECFVGIVHVPDTTSNALLQAVEGTLAKLGLSFDRLRGQGYDGASNMKGEYNGLKALVLERAPTAYYVHCFAHQLQLILVAVAKNHLQLATFFSVVSNIVTVASASCRRHDLLRERQVVELATALFGDDIPTGRGLNQELSLRRAGDTRWGSHYGSLLRLIQLYPAVISVIGAVMEDGTTSEQRAEARVLLQLLDTFEFAFCLHLMKTILGITNELSQALQRKDQDIVNAMNLVRIAKVRLQSMRDSGWLQLLNQVTTFCEKHDMECLNMEDTYAARGRPRRNAGDITNELHYRVGLFNTVIDMLMVKMNERFSEMSSLLLTSVGALYPGNSFQSFRKESVLTFAQQYVQTDFTQFELEELDNQLDTYILDVSEHVQFQGLKSISILLEKLVSTK